MRTLNHLTKWQNDLIMREKRIHISNNLLNILLKYAKNIGLDIRDTEILFGLDLKILNNPDYRISFQQFNAIWHRIVFLSKDDNFGLHLGEASHQFMVADIITAVMMNCATVKDAMEKLIRYHGLTTNSIRLQLNRQKDVSHFSWISLIHDISFDRHYTEAILCWLVFMLRGLTEDRICFLKIDFVHQQPEDIMEHRRIFRCPLFFDCPRNNLVIRSEDLTLPIFLANPGLLDKLEQFAQELLKRFHPSDTWANRVMQLMSKMLLRGETPKLNAVVSSLAVSRRSLQNKLKQEGVSYQILFDAVRKEIALQYLQRPEVGILEIAFLLGFSEQSAFNHAFRRWTGTSPKKYRKSAIP